FLCVVPIGPAAKATEALPVRYLPVVTVTCDLASEVTVTSGRAPRRRGGGQRKRRPTGRLLAGTRAMTARRCLLHSVGDAALGQVVGRHFDLDSVTGQDADVVLAHATGDVCDDLVSILQADPEGGVGQRLYDGAFEPDGDV